MARRLLPLLVAAALAACEQPPHRELEAAANAVEKARKGDAALYAPERMREAETALTEALRRVGTRDYRGALSAANDATEKARTATSQAAAARDAARKELGEVQDATRASLADAERAIAEAVDVKMPPAALESFRREVAQIGEAAARVEGQAGANLAEALREAKVLRERASVLAPSIRGDRGAWEVHRRSRPPARRR